MFILDIGCGDSPTGDINTDISIEDKDQHRSDKNHMDRYKIDIKKVSNFTICDAMYLPFQDNVFDLVVSRQVIEHVKNPLLMLQEMKRVSKDYVIIETVHRRGERINKSSYKQRKEIDKIHINKFDYTYFNLASKKLGLKVIHNKTLSERRFFNQDFFTFNISFPYEIRIIMTKQNKTYDVACCHCENLRENYLKELKL